MATAYEWTAEEIDAHGDITDVSFWDKLAEIPDLDLTRPGFDYGLLKRVGNEAAGETHRAYAYIRSGKLEATFDDGTKVPQRFHDELAKYKGVHNV
jgi:hypothetical protein